MRRVLIASFASLALVAAAIAVGATEKAKLARLAPGTYPVTCKIHPKMTGTLVIA